MIYFTEDSQAVNPKFRRMTIKEYEERYGVVFMLPKFRDYYVCDCPYADDIYNGSVKKPINELSKEALAKHAYENARDL